MSLWQSTMIQLARSQSMTNFMQGNPFTRKMASRFVGGIDVASAVAKAVELKEKGFTVSLFYLGEYLASPEAIEANVTQITAGICQLGQAGLDIHVSIDPTGIGYMHSGEFGQSNARRIAQAVSQQPAAARKFLMLDMEDFTVVQKTLDLRSRLAQEGCPTAITIQAYLHRSEQDIRDLIQSGVAAVRLVKGAFAESNEHAWTAKPQILRNYVHLATLLLSPEAKVNGTYPVFATHDDRLIETVTSLAQKLGWPRDAYEIEMLYGVRTGLQQQLVANGHQVRLYLPFGTDWWPYTVRRIGEKPANARFVFDAIWKR